MSETFQYQCEACGFPGRPITMRRDRLPVHHDCKSGSTVKLATAFAKAVAIWIAAGRPKRKAEEVKAMLAICRKCESYNGKSCSLCGCKISKSASALKNKIRMATEHCPIEKW